MPLGVLVVGSAGSALAIARLTRRASRAAGMIRPSPLGPSGDLAERLALPRLSGLYLMAAAAFLVAALLLASLLRYRVPVRSAERALERGEIRAGLRGARLALLVLGASNFVMVAVMAIAPIHLTEHGHGLDVVGVVIGVHVLCMFAPSPVTGWLADRAGSRTVAAIGAVLLTAAGVAGATLDMSDGATMTAMLGLLGLGWNAGVVAGSTLLAATVREALRPQTEGAPVR